jgi:hypothetical protein
LKSLTGFHVERGTVICRWEVTGSSRLPAQGAFALPLG